MSTDPDYRPTFSSCTCENSTSERKKVAGPAARGLRLSERQPVKPHRPATTHREQAGFHVQNNIFLFPAEAYNSSCRLSVPAGVSQKHLLKMEYKKHTYLMLNK